MEGDLPSLEGTGVPETGEVLQHQLQQPHRGVPAALYQVAEPAGELLRENRPDLVEAADPFLEKRDGDPVVPEEQIPEGAGVYGPEHRRRRQVGAGV